jgi:membrane-associated protease RseP (regulator of RpoE activity)
MVRPPVFRRPRSGVLNVVLLAVTALAAMVTNAVESGADPFTDPTAILRGLPFAVALIAILLVHESGHYLMCLRHGLDASLPYFLPAPLISPVGTFGAFIRIRSRFPHRNALFDVGAAGPWAGFVVALVATAVGLANSTVLPAPVTGPGIELGDSILTTLLTRAVLHADPANVVLHPVAFAGWFGLFVTSLNLLPVGQLDGGHVLYAAAGRATRVVPAVLIAAAVWLGLRGWPGWLLWAVIMTVLFSIGHPPTDDDRRPLGHGRQFASAATFVIFVLTFVAEPIRILH